jgi:hypothetical protein
MKLEDLAQNAARQARNAAQEMPIVPIKEARGRRRTGNVLLPVLGLAATWMVIAVLTPPPTQTPPVATNPTTTSIDNTQASTAVPNVFQTVVVVSDSDLAGFVDRTDSIWPLPVETVNPATDCCIAPGGDGELLALRPSRLLSVTDRVEQLIAWDDMDAKGVLATPGGLAIAGTEDSGRSVLRLYTRDGSLLWSLTLDLDWGETPQLALGSGNVIWRGVRDVFPADSGFAEVQWLPISTLDGTPVPADRRAEARPLPDGRSVLLTGHAVALVDTDGFGTRWEMPDNLNVLAADPFLDGLLVTAVADATNESGRVLVVVLRPGLIPNGLWTDRYFGPIAPGPTTIAATDQAVFGLGANDEGPFLSATSIETLYPLAPFSLDGVEWTGGDLQEVRSNSGTVLARGRFGFPGRAIAWDGNAGVVTFGEDGLRWFTEDGETAMPVPRESIGELVEVVAVDDGHTVGARLSDGSNTIWFELGTGRLTEAPASARSLDGVTFSAAGRSATINLPDWRDVKRGEGGEPISPFDLPELVVSSHDGAELLRISVGTSDRPYVQIHDFDGRRLIVSAVPNEPASPPQTVWIIDLECGDCTEIFETGGPVWFDLIGTLESGGPVVQPALPTVPTRGWPAP